MKPLVFDLYCGLGGWSAAFIDQGYRAVGFDVERHDYGAGGTRHLTNPSESEGVKGFTPQGQPLGKNEGPRRCGSKSRKRKEASALIAKIPPGLANWIAKCFKPEPQHEIAAT